MSRNFRSKQFRYVTGLKNTAVILFKRKLAPRVYIIARQDFTSSQLQSVTERSDPAEEVHDFWLYGRHQSLRKADREAASASISRVWHSQTTIDPHPKLVNSAVTFWSRATFSANFLFQ
jgi:hypothetical protein